MKIRKDLLKNFFFILTGIFCLCPFKVFSQENPIKVSIIIPVYNTVPYLKRCLDSAINQTLKDIEIICVNDGSTDNSLEILQKYAQKDKRVKVINHTENKGVAAARNTALRAAKGEFVGFLDSDDFVDKKFYENLYKNSPNFDVVKGIVLYDGYYIEKWKYTRITTSIVRRQFLLDKKLGFPQMEVGDDAAFDEELKREKARILWLSDNSIYYHYERRLGSLSNFTPEQLKPKGIKKY